MLRSFKRLLNDAGPTTTVDLAGRCYRLADLFAGFLAQLRSDLQHRSNAELSPGRAGRGRDQRAGQCLQRATLPDAGRVRAGRLRRGRAAQRAVGGGLRIRPPVSLDDHRQAGVRLDLRPRRRNVRRVAAEDDRAVERGGRQRGHPAPRRRRLRRGDPQAGPQGRRTALVAVGRPRSAARGVRGPQRSRRSQHPAISGRSHRGRQAAVLLPDRRRLHGLCSAGRQDDCRSVPGAARPGRRRRRLVRGRGHLRGGRRRKLPARRAVAALGVRRETGQTLTAPVRRDGDRPGGLPRQGGRIRALRTSFAPLRGVSRGVRGRGRLLRPDRAQRALRCPPPVSRPSSSRGPTARRTTSDTSASWSAAGCATAVPTAT